MKISSATSELDVTQSLPELTSLGEPTLYSLGLGNWSPAGMVQLALENLHVGLDLPWWGAIMLGLTSGPKFLKILNF